MTQNRLILFASLGLILLLFAYIQKERAISDYMTQKEELLVFEKEAKELGALKLKHKNKKSIERTLKTLTRIKAPSKDFTKSTLRVLEFDGLDVRVLNQLIKKIQNSSLPISKLEIVRVDASTAKIKMEIKR